MELNRNKSGSSEALYRALSLGDLPAAWLIQNKLSENDDPVTAFNGGLCLFLLEEWEKAAGELKRAERSFGNPADFDVSEKNLFLRAIETVGHSAAVLPLDPNSAASRTRYGMIRTKWLLALCLKKLERKQEAALTARFLAQYGIEIE